MVTVYELCTYFSASGSTASLIEGSRVIRSKTTSTSSQKNKENWG